MAYATPTEVLERMGQSDVTGGVLFNAVSAALDAATVAIDLDTDRTFTASTGARTFATSGTSTMDLPDFTAVTSVKLDDDDDGVFEVTVPASDYELDRSATERPDWPFDTIRLLDRCFPYGGRRRLRVEVTATWGWAAVPPGINQACSLLVVRLAQRAQAPLGVVSFGDIGSANIRNSDPDYVALIHPYDRRRYTGFA